MATIGELIIDLKANTASFVTDLNRVKNLSFETATQVQRSFSIMGTVGLGMVTAFAGGMAAAMEKTAQWEVHMLHLAQSTGVTVQTMSGLSHVAKMMEIDIDKVAIAMARFDKQLLSAQQGNKKATSMMETLGIDPKGIKTSDDALMLMADHFSKMKDGALKTGEAMQAFGKAGAAMIPILNLGRQGIKDYLDEAQRMGKVLTKDQAEAAETYIQNITRMKESFSGLVVKITNSVIPVMNDLVEHFRSDAKSMGSFQAAVDLAVVMLQNPREIDAYFKAGKRMSELAVEQRKAIKATEEHTISTSGHAKELEKLQTRIQAVIKEYTTHAATVGMSAMAIQNYKFAVDAAVLGDTKHVAILTEKIRKMDALQRMADSYAAVAAKTAADEANPRTGTAGGMLAKQYAEQADGMNKMAAAIEKMNVAAQAGTSTANPFANFKAVNANFAGYLREVSTELEKQRITYGMTNDQVTRYNLLLMDSSGAARQQIAQLKIQQDHFAQLQERVARLHITYQEFGHMAYRSLNDLIFSGKKFGDVLKDVTKLIGEMFLKWALFGGGPVKGGGILGSLFGSILGGILGGGAGKVGALPTSFPGLTHFAAGGSVASGVPILVGEQGAEIFRPSSAGTIIPNNQIGKPGGGVQITYNIDSRGADAGVEARIMRALQASENRAVARALQTAREANARAA